MTRASAVRKTKPIQRARTPEQEAELRRLIQEQSRDDASTQLVVNAAMEALLEATPRDVERRLRADPYLYREALQRAYPPADDED